jgi:hypothetical protein
MVGEHTSVGPAVGIKLSEFPWVYNVQSIESVPFSDCNLNNKIWLQEWIDCIFYDSLYWTINSHPIHRVCYFPLVYLSV